MTVPSGSLRLEGSVCLPEGPGSFPAVLLLHGLGSCRREHGDALERLAREGYLAAAFDLRGHGESPGRRGLWTLEGMEEDRRALVEALRCHPRADGRLAVVGHSLGCMAALAALGEPEAPPDCGVLLAPVDRILDSLKPWESWAYRLMYRLERGIPGLRIRIPYKVGYDEILEDPEARRRAREERLLQKSLPAENYRYLVEQADGPALARKVERPVLVLVGERDRVVPTAGSRRVHDALAGPKRWEEMSGTGHSILRDRGREDAWMKLTGWLALHLPAQAEGETPCPGG